MQVLEQDFCAEVPHAKVVWLLVHSGHLYSAQIKQIFQCIVLPEKHHAVLESKHRIQHVPRPTKHVNENQQQFVTACEAEAALPFEVKLNTASWIKAMGKCHQHDRYLKYV